MSSKRRSKAVAKATGHNPAIRELLTPPSVPQRQPDGRPAQPSRTEQRDEAQRTVAEARCRREGIPATLDNRRRVTRQDYGDALHAARRQGLIDAGHVEAGETYAELYARSRRVWGADKMFPRIVDLHGVRGVSADVMDDDAARALWAAWRDAWQAVSRAGQWQRLEVEWVALEGEPTRRPVKLREGLEALRWHFGVGG